MSDRGGLRGAGVHEPDRVGLGPVEELLARYRRYLLLERELDPTTVVGYVHRVRPFLAARVPADGLDLVGLEAADVNAFVLADCGRRTRQSAKLTVTALRSLLRFLHAEGAIGEALPEGVPSVAHWRLSGLPQHLEPEQVCALLDRCDRTTTAGVRTFPILKLLVRLGLRRCEVARLQLEDIDWRAGEVVIRGKRDRHDRLPLPAHARARAQRDHQWSSAHSSPHLLLSTEDRDQRGRLDQHLDAQHALTRPQAAIGRVLGQRQPAQRTTVAHIPAPGAVAAHAQNINPLPTQRVERVPDYQRIRRAVT